jgi:sugar transferase (PEP-CTERM/EpsH1 system associated)
MRVLVLSQRLPYAPNRGDRLRVYHMIREIAPHAEVDVAALVHDRDEESHAADLNDMTGEVITAMVPRARNAMRGAASLAGSTPLTHSLLDSPSLKPALASLVERRRPDVVLAFCSSMARFAIEPPLADLPLVIDMIDADSAKWSVMAETSRPPMRWIYRREARLLGRFEVVSMERAFTTLVVNEKERAALLSLSPAARVIVVENGVDLASFAPPASTERSPTVVFCGVMNYAPNVQGAVWLSREVWPLVRAARPHAKLQIVGASPSAEVMALADTASHIEVTGAVPDVRPYLWNASVAAAPLAVARGVQNKVLEAVAAGLPCVVTPQVADGLPTQVEAACRVARDAQEFSAALVEILGLSPAGRGDRTAAAQLDQLRWSARLATLMPLLEAAASAPPGSHP